MLMRYKTYPNDVRECLTLSLNTHALNEVLTGDDSAHFHDLEIQISEDKDWKSLVQAIKDKDIIIDDRNTYLVVSHTPEDRERG